MRYLIKNATLLPMTKWGYFFKSDLLIENEEIKKIAPSINEKVDVIIDAKNSFVLPGFIQGHIHLVQTLLRHQADDLELLDWLKKKTWPYEASLDGDSVEVASELGISELLLGGTTTICDFGTTHNHERVFKAVDRMGLRYIGGKVLMDEGHGVPGQLLEKTEASLRDMYDLGKKWHNKKLIKYAATPRFVLSCSEKLIKETVKMARENNWYLQTHSSENQSEIKEVKKKTKLSNIEYLKKMKFLGEDTILAHCIHLSKKEISILEKTKTRICHCPGSNLKLASGIADVPILLKKKIPVMLGADGAPCNNRLSIFNEMYLTSTIHKVKYGPRAMSAWQVLDMATRLASQALKLDKEIGTLEVGKKADIAIVSRDSTEYYPEGDPASQIVYGGSAKDVSHVFVNGELLVEKGTLKKMNQNEILKKSVEAWREVSKKMRKIT